MVEQPPERSAADGNVSSAPSEITVPDIESVLSADSPPPGAVPGTLPPEDIESVLRDGDRDPQIKYEPYDPSRAREWTRVAVVAALVLLLAVIVIVPLIAIVWGGKSYDEMQGFLSLVFGSLSALVGSAVGFYFGERRQ